MKTVINVSHTLDVKMEVVPDHGNVIAIQVGVACTATKVCFNFALKLLHPYNNFDFRTYILR